MSRIRSKDTSIELALRKALWAAGIRYRKHYRRVPGSPDVAIVSHKIAVFCDSTFWHGRDWQERKRKMLSNRDYWVKKIEGNIARDERINRELSILGWKVVRFWDIEISKNIEGCVDKILHMLADESKQLYCK